MKLEFKKFGQGNPLFIIHGLYGSGDNWFTIGRNLMDRFTIYLVDLRNHGNSPHDPAISYDLMTTDLEELFESEKITKANLMGHSLGGKVVMNFALKYPGKVEKLVVIDVALRSYSAQGSIAPQTLQHQKIIKALASLDITVTDERNAIDQQLSNEISSKTLRQFLLKNLKRYENGAFYWGLNIDAIQRNMLNLMDSVKVAGRKFNGSVLIIRGTKSGYISDTDYTDFLQVFPAAKIEDFETGHWVHAEQPDRLIRLLKEFLPDTK